MVRAPARAGCTSKAARTSSQYGTTRTPCCVRYRRAAAPVSCPPLSDSSSSSSDSRSSSTASGASERGSSCCVHSTASSSKRLSTASIRRSIAVTTRRGSSRASGVMRVARRLSACLRSRRLAAAKSSIERSERALSAVPSTLSFRHETTSRTSVDTSEIASSAPGMPFAAACACASTRTPGSACTVRKPSALFTQAKSTRICWMSVRSSCVAITDCSTEESASCAAASTRCSSGAERISSAKASRCAPHAAAAPMEEATSGGASLSLFLSSAAVSGGVVMICGARACPPCGVRARSPVCWARAISFFAIVCLRGGRGYGPRPRSWGGSGRAGPPKQSYRPACR